MITIQKKSVLQFLLVLVTVCINGCKKDKAESIQIFDPALIQAKSWYDNTFHITSQSVVSTASGINTNIDFTTKIAPDWKHADSYNTEGEAVIEMPIDPEKNMGVEFKNMNTGEIYSDQKYNRTYFLIMKEGENYTAYIMMVMADAAYVMTT